MYGKVVILLSSLLLLMISSLADETQQEAALTQTYTRCQDHLLLVSDKKTGGTKVFHENECPPVVAE